MSETDPISRRALLRTGALLASRAALQAAPPSLAIAHYKSPAAAPDAIAEEALRLTRAAIQALGGMGRFVSNGNIVWVKPNIAWDRRPEQAACTNPDVVAALVQLCFEAGARKVLVGDNAIHPAERTFARSGIQAAAEKAGAQCIFPDPRRFRRMAIAGSKVLRDWEIYPGMVECDRLINVGIVKHHSLCRAAMGMKNLMGAAGGPRNRFHQDITNCVADLAGFLKPQLVVLDAIRVLTANGPTGGNLADVRRQDIVAAGADQVAADAFGATLLGLQPSAVGYIAEGHARGIGTMNFQSLAPPRLEV